MKKTNKMSEETPVQQVAANFAGQYTDEDLNTLSNMSLGNLKEYLQAVAVSCLEFAEENTGAEISILPGRPDRPKKPNL